MQAVYVLFRDDDAMKLPYFIAIAGFVCALFAISIPHLSALRIWLGVSTVLSLIYIIIAIVLSTRDGKSTNCKFLYWSSLIFEIDSGGLCTLVYLLISFFMNRTCI